MEFISNWATETWQVMLEAGPWLVGGFVLAGVIHVFVPVERVARHLGGSDLASVLKASLLGVPLPLCSCSVIPVAASIRKQGAGRGATASFLISTPETGADSIAVSYALLGPFLAIARPIAAFVTAFVAGAAINRFAPEPAQAGPEPTEPGAELNQEASEAKEKASSCCCCHGDSNEDEASASTPAPSWADRLVGALRYGLGDMFADLGHWLLLGFVLAGLIGAVVPEGFFGQHLGTGPLAFLAMIAVALPLYVCATSSTPIAAALIAAGISPGTALVFLLVGPATNIATMVVVARTLGRRSLILYIVCIVIVAVLFGLITDVLISTSTGGTATHALHAPHMSPAWLTIPSAIILALLILRGMLARLRRRTT